MKAADLRAIVGRMTAAPWYPRGRFLSRASDNTGAGATMHTNHIGIIAQQDDVTGAAALRNHADSLLALQEAVGARKAARCWSRGADNSGWACVCGWDAAPECPCTVAEVAVFAAHSAIEALSPARSPPLRAPENETQQSISQWAHETFGDPVSNLSIAKRAEKEMKELLTSLEFLDRNTHAPVEAADVIIVLMRLFERFGTTWQAEVDKKMAVNRARTWVLDGEGHGSHVKETR